MPDLLRCAPPFLKARALQYESHREQQYCKEDGRASLTNQHQGDKKCHQRNCLNLVLNSQLKIGFALLVLFVCTSMINWVTISILYITGISKNYGSARTVSQSICLIWSNELKVSLTDRKKKLGNFIYDILSPGRDFQALQIGVLYFVFCFKIR